MSRKFPRPVKRIVIKIGSSVIATYKMKPRSAQLSSLVKQICAAQKKGIEVIVVSSGAIVLGMGGLNQKKRPNDLSSLQAMAAVGQTILMRTYDNFFKRHKGKCAQILLTWDDFNNRTRYNNARGTLKALLDRGICPIINENDTISTDEIKFGDNDKLSALVASLVDADLLLMLSDVEGLYDLKGEQKKLIREIAEITGDIERIAGGTTKEDISKGGMIAKLEAIKIVSLATIPCIIAHGEAKNILRRILKGERLGTFFSEKKEKLIARKHWISFGAKPQGIIIVDDGARSALVEGGKSLLLPGIASWKGDFKKDDVVVVQDKKGDEIARGIINYSTAGLHQTEEKRKKMEAIHRDNLVLCRR